MQGIGTALRAMRQQRAFTLREVEDRSNRLAHEWGNPSYRISASWLDRVEREDRGLSAGKLVVLAAIHGTPSDLLALCPLGNATPQQYDQFSNPNATILLSKGPMEYQARLWLPDDSDTENVPDNTELLPTEQQLSSQYRRAIVGRKDKTLEPMVRAGSIY